MSFSYTSSRKIRSDRGIKRGPKSDIKSLMKKVYKQTSQYKLEQLLKQESYWKRKETIASNKLKNVRKKLSAMLCELVQKDIPNIESEVTHE
jgi:hypothetical protein